VFALEPKTGASAGFFFFFFFFFGAGAPFFFFFFFFFFCARAHVSGFCFSFLLSKTFPATGCCSPSMPAVVGCLWTGVVYVFFGACSNWALFDTYRRLFSLDTPSASPGYSFLIFAVLCLVAAAILFSYAGCLLRGMPGVGASRSNCCCVERGTPIAPAASLYQQPVATHPIAGYPQVAPGFPAATFYQQPVAAYPLAGYPHVDPSMAAYPTPQGPPGMVVRSKDDPSTVAV